MWYGNTLYDFSDVLFLDEEATLRPVYDVTAKHAMNVIETIKYQLSWWKNTPDHERKRLEAHLARYEDILDKHTTYKRSFSEFQLYTYK